MPAPCSKDRPRLPAQLEACSHLGQNPPAFTLPPRQIATAAGAKTTAARSIGRTVAKIANDETSGLPWWRVVSSVGALQSNPARQEAQLERLRAEGARPNEGAIGGEGVGSDLWSWGVERRVVFLQEDIAWAHCQRLPVHQAPPSTCLLQGRASPSGRPASAPRWSAPTRWAPCAPCLPTTTTMM